MRKKSLIASVVGLLLILTIGPAGCSSSSEEATTTPSKGAAEKHPPEDPYANLQSPYPNVDQANARNAPSSIEAANVSELTPAWSLSLDGAGAGDGPVASPAISNDVVYLQDPNSNVMAVDLTDGAILWEKRYEVPALGGSGVTVSRGFDLVFGATPTHAFALDEETGKEVWSVRLVPPGSAARIGIAPGYYNGLIYFATRSHEGAAGRLWALDVRSGAKAWESAGALADPPAFDEEGSLFAGIGSSVVRFDEATGKPRWRSRVTRYNSREGSVGPPVIARYRGRKVIVAGSDSGVVVALNRKTGKALWRRPVGTPRAGSVSGPLAVRGSTVFVPAERELLALDVGTGTVRWKVELSAPLRGPTTVTNDLVFAARLDGAISAFEAKTGREASREQLPTGVEGGVAIGGETLVVRAGIPGDGGVPELLAYRVGG